MGEMFEIVIYRKPGDCDFDLKEVCKSVSRQNSEGNLLRSWEIAEDKITLNYETK